MPSSRFCPINSCKTSMLLYVKGCAITAIPPAFRTSFTTSKTSGETQARTHEPDFTSKSSFQSEPYISVAYPARISVSIICCLNMLFAFPAVCNTSSTEIGKRSATRRAISSPASCRFCVVFLQTVRIAPTSCG